MYMYVLGYVYTVHTCTCTCVMYGNTEILVAKQFSNAINILFLFTWQLLVTSDAVFVQQKRTCVQHSGWSFGLSIHKKTAPGSSYLLNGSEIFFSNQRYEFDVKRFTLSASVSVGEKDTYCTQIRTHKEKCIIV